MKTRHLLSYCAAVFCLVTPSLFAQGSGFTYQGRLQLNGTSVSGHSDLTFTLFDAATGGNKVGTPVVANDVSVTNGLFTVVLDFGTAAFDGSARWLQIDARAGDSTGAFTPLAPRQTVTATPYAIFAGKVAAAGLSGKISGAQIADGSIGVVQLAPTIGSWDRSGNDLVYLPGNINVGDATPATALGYPSDWRGVYVNSPSSPGLAILEGNGVARLHLRDRTAEPNNRNFVVDNANNHISFRWLFDNLANRWDAITIDTDGLVGIGDTAPTERLSVGGNLRVSGAIASTGAISAGGTLSAAGLLTASAGISSAADVAITGRILASRAGIGIGAPLTPVHVVAAGDTELSLESADNHRRWTLQASGGAANVSKSASFQIIDRTAGASRMYIATNGNVGFGTTTPATALDVNGEVTLTACNITSDRNAKEQFKPVNSLEVLEKVSRLPISEWQYKTQGDARHIGPMAQDFRAAFSLGHDERHITTVDADGVALAAIQGLNQLVQDQRQTIAALQEHQHRLEQEFADKLAQLEKRIASNGRKDDAIKSAAANH